MLIYVSQVYNVGFRPSIMRREPPLPETLNVFTVTAPELSELSERLESIQYRSALTINGSRPIRR